MHSVALSTGSTGTSAATVLSLPLDDPSELRLPRANVVDLHEGRIAPLTREIVAATFTLWRVQ
jgi:hypothetical protein